MKRYEDEILDNKNLDAPNDAVLEKAKSAIRENKKPRRKLSARKIFAIVSACAAILVVIFCIPYMMPAQSGMKLVENNALTTVQIGSIARYNEEEGARILHFDSSVSACGYSYQNKMMFLEEHVSIDGCSAVLLVDILQNTVRYMFEKTEEYTAKLSDVQTYSVADKTVFWTAYDDAVYLSMNYDGYVYYMKIEGDIANWQNLLNDFLN